MITFSCVQEDSLTVDARHEESVQHNLVELAVRSYDILLLACVSFPYGQSSSSSLVIARMESSWWLTSGEETVELD